MSLKLSVRSFIRYVLGTEDTWHGTIGRPYWEHQPHWQLVHLDHEYSSYQVLTALDYCNMYANVTTSKTIFWMNSYLYVACRDLACVISSTVLGQLWGCVSTWSHFQLERSFIKMIMTQTYMSLRAATGQAPSSQPPSTCRNQNMLLRPVPRTEDTAGAPLAAAEKSLETVKEWPGDEAECGRGVQSSCSSFPASCSGDGEVLV